MDDSKIYVGFRAWSSDIAARRPGQLISFSLAFLSLALYAQIAFFTKRTDTTILIGSYSILFIMYWLLTRSILGYKYLIGFGIAFRLLFVFSVPNLSDDYFRFIWDSILTNNQVNPFLFTPRAIIENPLINLPGLDLRLFSSLNSPEYHSVYPPVCQFVFWIANHLSDGNLRLAVLIMKAFVFVAELGTIFMIIKLLKLHHLRREYIYYYILNPLVIIEITGNIHFDGVMVFFVLLAVYLLHKNQLLLASMAFALAVATKLTPLILQPFLYKRLKFSRLWVFYGLTLVFAIVTFWPFLSPELIDGMGSGLSLYFQKFEFNASIFYIVRAIGFWIKGWDIIQKASFWMALSSGLIMVYVAFFANNTRQNIPGIFIWPFFIYFAFSSIIHPWYAIPLVAFCIFSNYRFPLIWSFTIFLSYAGYSTSGFHEPLWVLLLEYIPVYAAMIYELWKHRDLVKFGTLK